MRVPSTVHEARSSAPSAPTRTVGRPVWLWLVAVNLVGFAAQGISAGDGTLLDLAVPTGSAIDDGELWRPLTSLVVHPGGWSHLGVNAVLLLAAARRAERALGCSRRFLATYVAIGFATNAIRYAVGGVRGGGASSAIFAVLGAGGAVALLRSDLRRRERALRIATIALAGGGLLLARTVNDSHVLALGLGALCGQAPERRGSRAVCWRLAAVAIAGLVSMAAPSLAS